MGAEGPRDAHAGALPPRTAGAAVAFVAAPGPRPAAPLGFLPLLRAATPDDARPIVALLAAVASEHTLGVDPAGFREEEEAARLAQLDLARACALVAERGGAVTGFALAVRGAEPATAHTAAVSVAVAREDRGHGLGRLLLGGLESWARAAGLRKLCAGVVAGNHAALRLFHARGYAPEGLRRQQVAIAGRLCDEVLLGRVLEEGGAAGTAPLGARRPRGGAPR